MASGPTPSASSSLGITALGPGSSGRPDARIIRGITPDITDWLPDLVEQLLPDTASLVRQRLTEYDPYAVLDERPGCFVQEVLLSPDVAYYNPQGIDADNRLGVDALGGTYASALTTYVCRFARVDGGFITTPDDLTARDAELYNHCLDVLTSFDGQPGPGPWYAGLDALEAGPLAIHRELDDTPRPLRLYLDADAWASLDDVRSGQTALDAITRLTDVFPIEIVVSSSRLLRALQRVDEAWCEEHLQFTESRTESTPATPAEDADAEALAVEALAGWSDGDGHLRILANIPEDGCQQRRLVDDPEVSLSTDGGVSRYVGDLEAAGLVTVDTTGQYNELALTVAGEAAVALIDPETYAVRDPAQTSLDAYFTLTPQPAASAVYRAHGTREGGEAVPSAEDWLADTGDPTAPDSDYVQWLNGPTDTLDAWLMHNRITAAVRGDGVTLVEDRIQAFDDARVGYASCFEDELLGVVQYGKPLRTMGRLVGVLLGERVLSKVLSPERVGADLEGFYAERREDLEAEVQDVLKWGHQIDARFFSSDDVDDYEDFREAVREVRQWCLERLGELVGSEAFDKRGELLRDLHGLVTSATHLHHAVGVDVVLNVRVPRSSNWDDLDRRDFLEFVQYLAEKQTVYKHHSGHRMLFEERPDKLQRRLPYGDDLDPGDITMETTADLLVTGPAMVELFDEVETALSRNQHRLRETVATGQEAAAVMEIPVHNGSSYAAVRELVEELASRKGYQTAAREQVERIRRPERRASVERLARLLLTVFNTAERPHRCSPHDVVEALYRMAGSSREVDWLRAHDVEAGLVRMAPTRLLPDLPPTMTQLIQAVVASEEPMGRSEILEQTGMSGSSYDRHIREAAALDILERVEVEGRAAYTGRLEPWWSPQTDQEEPYDRERRYDDGEIGAALGLVESFAEPLTELAFSVEGVYEAVDDEVFSWPYDLREMTGAHPVLRRWRGWFWATFVDEERLAAGPSEGPPEPDDAVVQVGRPPAAAATGQMSLEEDLHSEADAGQPALDQGSISPDGVGEGSQ
jgi:hypothetical protein